MVIMIDGERVVLTEVATNLNGDKLYRLPLENRICCSPLQEVKKRFPEYDYTHDAAYCDYLFEENGTLVLYDADGNVADNFELITEEEINKTE
jgi:hypothetical protein